MSDKIFLDTNIYIYFFDQSNPEKHKRARSIIRDLSQQAQAVISFQVIHEFCNLALGKFKNAITPDDTIYFIQKMMYPYCEVFPSFSLIESAIHIRKRFMYSYYDSMILAAAIESGSKFLYTEDLQHGAVIKGVEIVNPFI